MKIQEIIQEVDASRRGFLKGVAGVAAASALPSVPAGMVKQVMKDLKPNNARVVKDLLDHFDIRQIYHIFRTWDDPDMWETVYLFGHGKGSEDGRDLSAHFEKDWERFREKAPRDDPRVRNSDKYVDYRLAMANADRIGMSPADIERVYSQDDEEGMLEISRNWPKYLDTIDNAIGRKSTASVAAEILNKHGVNIRDFEENEELWDVLNHVYWRSFEKGEWPEGWPRFEEMLRRESFAITPEGNAVPASEAPATPPSSPEQFASMLRSALSAAASLMKRGKKPDARSLEVPANLNVTLNKPETGPGTSTATPASLPAPAPGIDLGLGRSAGERVPVGNREKTG